MVEIRRGPIIRSRGSLIFFVFILLLFLLLIAAPPCTRGFLARLLPVRPSGAMEGLLCSSLMCLNLGLALRGLTTRGKRTPPVRPARRIALALRRDTLLIRDRWRGRVLGFDGFRRRISKRQRSQRTGCVERAVVVLFWSLILTHGLRGRRRSLGRCPAVGRGRV